MENEERDARAEKRNKLVGRIVVIVFGLLVAAYLLPLFIPALRFI